MKTSIYAATAAALFASSICSVAAAGAEGADGAGGKPSKAKERGAAPAATTTDPVPAGAADPKTDAAAGAEGADAKEKAAEAPSRAKPESLGLATLSHPDGATSCSHGGQTYSADKHGHVVVPLAAVEDLTSHGFVLVR